MSPVSRPWQGHDLAERRHRLREVPRTEQLDLFADNRRTIWHNQAYEALEMLDLDGALASYGRIVQAGVDDNCIRDEVSVVAQWQERLIHYGESDRSAQEIHKLYVELTDATPPPLERSLLELMVEELCALEAPELVFISPRFHPGLLYLELGRQKEAHAWLARAVAAGIQPAGRFLAYFGDSTFLLGDQDTARELYREAFLEGPETVDWSHLADPVLKELISYAEGEADDPDELLPWLSVWGWLQGIFTLDFNELNNDRSGFLESLAQADTEGGLASSQLWFRYLRYAEFLRRTSGDRQELIRARRRMRELNGELFERYMRKIS